MADEQIIYLSPNEELTNVRERLEQTPARRIILVIPQQTKLRSHVGWRLLHSRARELNKDVLVISSDRQIRAVAKAADFRIADSLESPTASQSRPSSHPSRMGGGGKPSGRPRSSAARATPENRSSRHRDIPARQFSSPNEPQLAQPSTPDTQSKIPPADTHKERATAPGSSTFSHDKQYGQDYDFIIDTAPSVRPLVPQHEDEEPDPLIEDFNVARRIREAAQQGEIDSVPPPSQPGMQPQTKPHSYGPTYAQNEEVDPFAYMEDNQPASLPEQHGATFIHELDTDVPDISERPTDVIVDGDIEDLGDEGDILDQHSPSPDSWGDPALVEPDAAESSRIYGMRPRNSRMGNIPYTPIEDEDTLLPLPDQPTRITPPNTVRQPAPGVRIPAANNRPPQPIIQPQLRGKQGKSAPQQVRKRPGAVPPTGPRKVVTTPAARKPAPKRSNSRSTAIILIAIVLFFLIIAALAYLGPSADIRITVPSQSISLQSLKFTATGTSKLDLKNSTLPAELLTFTTHVDGSAPVSSTTAAGSSTASGSVTFTNNSSQSIVIPMGVIITTHDGKEFLTDGEFTLPGNGGTFPVTIHARDSGPDGNVAANSITVIPQTSITQIELYWENNNISIPPGALTVNNSNPTTGGGAGSSTVVTNDNVKTLQAQLDKQKLQPLIDAWMSKNVHPGDNIHPGDVAGQPVKNENPVPNPKVGQLLHNGSFSERVNFTMKILVVRAATIEAAINADLNATLMKQGRGYSIVPQQPLVVGKPNNTSPAAGNAIVFSYRNPTGQSARLFSEQQVSTLLAGKRVSEAVSDFKNGAAGIPKEGDAQINVSPSFFPLLPFRPDHIHYYYIAVPGKGTHS